MNIRALWFDSGSQCPQHPNTMNLTNTIGRYEVPITQILAVQKRTGWRGWFRPGYDVFLLGGLKLHFTEAEKAELDAARAHHQQVMKVMGMVGSMQAANRPRG